jgi:hypothetical protein
VLLPVIPHSHGKIVAVARALAKEIRVPDDHREEFVVVIAAVVVSAWDRSAAPAPNGGVPPGVERLQKAVLTVVSKIKKEEEAVRWIVHQVDGGDHGEGEAAIERLRGELLLGPLRQILGAIGHAKQSGGRRRGGQTKENRPDYQWQFETFVEDLYQSTFDIGVSLGVSLNSASEGKLVKAIRILRPVLPAVIGPKALLEACPKTPLDRIVKRVKAEISQRQEDRKRHHLPYWVLNTPKKR